jgi:prepilin-type N-terminal cleavage/methylation domain-containing protein
MKRGFTLIELLICVAIVGILASIIFGGVVSCDGFGYGRDLQGEVVSQGQRVKAGENGMQQKVSLVVKATTVDAKLKQVAGGPSGVAIECLSTRCASIQPYTCHDFDCKVDFRMMEPDVVVCKHAREIKGQGV